MKENNISFRLEKEDDYEIVENMIRDSFWNVYMPGCLEHLLIHNLRSSSDFVKELDIVMEMDGEIIGQNVFARAEIKTDDERTIPCLTMGPISVLEKLKRQGFGKMLLDYSLEKAKELGYGAVLIEGNIEFYKHSGFDYSRKYNIRYHELPEGEDDLFFLCCELKPGYLDNISGVYQSPSSYNIDEKELEEYDKKFPAKEKLKLPGQLF